MTFRLYAQRFCFTAKKAVQFPAGGAGNTLRGALGLSLRRIGCPSHCTSPDHCPVDRNCAYGRIFDPGPTAAGPSGFANWPRPFVLRASGLDGRTFEPGADFCFDLHVFDMRQPDLEHYTRAFESFAESGVGLGRGSALLKAVDSLTDQGELLTGQVRVPLNIDLSPARDRIREITVQFVSPAELKGEGVPLVRPDFGVLFRRARDRVGTLRSLYGDGPLLLDFKTLGAEADRVAMTSCDIQHVAAERRSTRTGQVHGLGGFVGEARYHGDLTSSVPFLQAACWTGIGRQTTWGKGAIKVLL